MIDPRHPNILFGAGLSMKPSNVLSPRQREVLKLIAEGNTTKQIALVLNISVKTVETHRMRLTKRLNIHHTAGLVHYAIKAGLVPLDD